MLDFILSKLNLLILVTAIFAIVSFFTFSLTDIAKVKEATELASRINESASALASSPSYCLSDFYPLPDELQIAGSSYYYVLKISKREITSGANPVNLLIFSIYPREEIKKSFESLSYVPKAIAANSFRTQAEIFLYAPLYDGTGYEAQVSDLTDEIEITLDMQAINPANSIEMVKEIVNGKPKLYVIGCNVALCQVYKTSIGDGIHRASQSEEGGFQC